MENIQNGTTFSLITHFYQFKLLKMVQLVSSFFYKYINESPKCNYNRITFGCLHQIRWFFYYVLFGTKFVENYKENGRLIFS